MCDEEDSLRRCGMRVAGRLERFGILRDESICAHCVHLDVGELETVRQSGSWLVHNCRSNMNNRVGRAPLAQFGDRAGLGTDGIDEDMFAESRTAFFRAREDDLSTGADRITSLLAGSAGLASQFFPYRVGVLERGAAADLIVLDYDPPTPLSDANLAWHWMFALTSGVVESVMVGGAWVLRMGECVTVDEEKVRAEARTQAARLWQRMDEM
jgi:cytosine/adenosine deaminase-related metal-dependent hydrolase